MASQQRRQRYYREFLTPALHRRFSRGAVVTLAVCYIESLLFSSQPGWFWWWFPLGRSFVRTLFLFICSLVIFILRLSQLHFGERTTDSYWQFYKGRIFTISTAQRLAFYLVSAWIFAEVYIWSTAAGADLGLTIKAEHSNRHRLNERPIFLRSNLYLVAVEQSFIHWFYDYDRIALPIAKAARDSSTPQQKVVATLPDALGRKIVLAAGLSFANWMLYWWKIRSHAWRLNLRFTRIFVSIPAVSAPPAIPPYHWRFLVRTMSSAVLLLFLWEVSNTVFTVYVAQEPLKNELPLTTESPTPNGTLLSGLKSKKEVVRTFAFWELLCISTNSEIRRRTIFNEIDRADGSTWSQVMMICLDRIKAVGTRISEARKSEQSVPPQQQQMAPESPLPRLSRLTKDASSDDVLKIKPRPAGTVAIAEQSASAVAKYVGNPASPGPTAAEEFWTSATRQLSTVIHHQSQQPGGLIGIAQGWIIQFLCAPYVGPFFQKTLCRRLRKVILGLPSDFYVLVCSIDALSNLAMESLNEDRYGSVHRTLATIIREFVAASTEITAEVGRMQVHWTDVHFQEDNGQGRRDAEVEIVRQKLTAGLRQILETFQGYTLDVGLSQAEMRQARSIAGLGERQ